MFSLAGGSESSLPSEETPWQSDSASMLLPKALLPTPSSRYCQPPPAYRAHHHQRAPLFPVPPPGSCLVPPPPLAGEGVQGVQGAVVVTPSKVERWRKMSWTGEPGELASPSPSPTSQPATFYNYKSSNSLTAPVRRRTLLEVPMQTKTESESVQGNNPINIFQSRLDPNSRPFTPAVSASVTLTEEDLQSETASLSLLTSEPDSSASTANQPSLLPDDPKLFLCELDLDLSQDEPTDGKTKASPSQELKISLPGALTDSILPPPIFPFTSHWSGKSRPPLLPTPKNFPPFGPRQSGETNAGVFTHHDPPQLSPGPGLASQESLAVRKAGMLRRVSGEINTPLTPGNLGTASSTSKMILSEDLAEAEAGWLPLGLSWMPPSLVESHPAPDEYCVNKVIGPKLPPLKLQNCHTDLLFFIFYSFHSDLQQMLAASLLFDRGWRYHKVDQVWLARWPGLAPERKSSENNWEEGLYQYFDVKVWKRIPGWFRLHYDKLGRSDFFEEDFF